MCERPEPTNFLAVLIYEDGKGWRCEEPRVYTATHPEIAYQRALADGKEHRYCRTFLGLSQLEEVFEDVEPIARSQKGDAHELVVQKADLAAFQDPRWMNEAWDEEEMRRVLEEPPLLFELGGLDDIQWHTYSHAYGPAFDVPVDLRRLTSSDKAVREQALWQLEGSIYHQGSIYGATAIAVPFLVRIATDDRFPEQCDLLGFILEITRSSAWHPEQIRRAWRKKEKLFGRFWTKSCGEMADDDVANKTAVRNALLNELVALRKLSATNDANMQTTVNSICDLLETPLSPELKCAHCRGTGACFCKRGSQVRVEKCERCNGTGKCHICHGTGVSSD